MLHTQVLLLNRLGDRLVVYCANSHISLYHLYTEENDKRKYCHNDNENLINLATDLTLTISLQRPSKV